MDLSLSGVCKRKTDQCNGKTDQCREAFKGYFYDEVKGKWRRRVACCLLLGCILVVTVGLILLYTVGRCTVDVDFLDKSGGDNRCTGWGATLELRDGFGSTKKWKDDSCRHLAKDSRFEGTCGTWKYDYSFTESDVGFRVKSGGRTVAEFDRADGDAKSGSGSFLVP